MTNDKDKFGKLLPNNERRTKFGDFLRKASIDELPELAFESHKYFIKKAIATQFNSKRNEG
jgi:hypothetical protein